MGLRGGKAAASAYRRGAELVKLRVAWAAKLVVRSARALAAAITDAIVDTRGQWVRGVVVVVTGRRMLSNLSRNNIPNCLESLDITFWSCRAQVPIGWGPYRRCRTSG